MLRLVKAVSIGLIVYVGSFAAIQFTKPEFLNSNEGPGSLYQNLYYPLRYLAADKPDYYYASLAGPLAINADWINEGNGSVYFTWQGKEYRAFYGNKVPPYEYVRIRVDYTLETNDDFINRLVPTVNGVATL